VEDRDRLPIIIRHWIEHNKSHLEEYSRWGQRAGELGWERVKVNITGAMEKLSQSNSCLEEALKELESV
jgi:hypothetical protein